MQPSLPFLQPVPSLLAFSLALFLILSLETLLGTRVYLLSLSDT